MCTARSNQVSVWSTQLFAVMSVMASIVPAQTTNCFCVSYYYCNNKQFDNGQCADPNEVCCDLGTVPGGVSVGDSVCGSRDKPKEDPGDVVGWKMNYKLDETRQCLLPALAGECHNYTTCWYYDSLEAQCRQFYYGGCGGNHNNFQSQEDCQSRCTSEYEPPPPEPDSRPQPQLEELLTTAQPVTAATTEVTVTVGYDNGTDCENSTFGCCPDGIIAANGPEYEGCEGVEEPANCSDSAYGCCPDGNTTATGPGQQGCPAECLDQPYGCCQDNLTPAHGPNNEGCCLLEEYGCCPDNILPAQGPNLEGCGCQNTTYGCCPDNSTAAQGFNNQGCGCQFTPYGCCPNQYTPAAGPGYQGCPCYTYQFGCCPDGVTRAIGPNLQGCGCENTQFGCCADKRTPAPGPDLVCECAASTFGCCPDGISEALGEKFEGCTDVLLGPRELCSLPKDKGSCREFTMKWFYDTEYGGCSHFLYGGCDGNQNRFKTQDECKQTCVEPPGRDACQLPKAVGPCVGYYPVWYFDADRKQCSQFVYGGCLGNANKFETREACKDLCITPDNLDACEEPVDEGQCQGHFTRWYYYKEGGYCTTFNYGGCKGNNNNFLSEWACQQKCLQPGRSKDACEEPVDEGPCQGNFTRWYYYKEGGYCTTFNYGGCKGNNNNFLTERACQQKCLQPGRSKDECALPRAQGSCNERIPRWFFDASENRCTPFYYSGCDGNSNNFETRDVCEAACPAKIGIFVHPLCTDDPNFASCHPVVMGQYCTHKYYSKFCCKSCTLAGQLPSHGPHLEALKRE